jgi:ElaB/YqjD/DUF883 family membrane-anchored ribosome-binding protein
VDSELEVIRHEMEGTRTSLAEKLDTLENEVLGTVHNATAAVANTVEDVKSVVGSVTESIEDTVESVKEAFNLNEQVRRHPWAMLGGAAGVGFLTGWLLGPSRREPEVANINASWRPPDTPRIQEKPSEPTHTEHSGFAPVDALKGIALSVLMGVVREMVMGSMPESLKADVANVLDDFTTKLGARPLKAEETAEETQASAQQETGNGKHPTPEETKPVSQNGGKEAAGQRGRGRGGSRFR